MKKLSMAFFPVLAAFILVFTACRKVEMEKMTIAGSTTVLPIAQVAAEEFMEANPNVDISVRGGGSGVGIASLIEGTCDIANASRPVKDKELDSAAKKGIYPIAHIVARDGIAVIIHPSNHIKGLRKDQIKDIYTGKISNWLKVGGPDKKIVVISRDTASGTFEAFNKLAMDKAKVRPDALLAASNRTVAATAAQTPCAVGYVGLAYVTDKVKAIKIDGVVCTKETVLSGKYPLSRPLFMYTDGRPEGKVKELIDFILSRDGQKLMEEAGYTGQ